MSIMGCGADELTEILTALGYRAHHVEAEKQRQEATTIDAAAGEAKAVPLEQAAVKTVWRATPRTHHAGKKPGGKKPAHAATGKKNEAQKHSKKARRGKAKKTADPSSPFAVLQQLNSGAQNADEA